MGWMWLLGELAVVSISNHESWHYILAKIVGFAWCAKERKPHCEMGFYLGSDESTERSTTGANSELMIILSQVFMKTFPFLYCQTALLMAERKGLFEDPALAFTILTSGLTAIKQAVVMTFVVFCPSTSSEIEYDMGGYIIVSVCVFASVGLTLL